MDMPKNPFPALVAKLHKAIKDNDAEQVKSMMNSEPSLTQSFSFVSKGECICYLVVVLNILAVKFGIV